MKKIIFFSLLIILAFSFAPYNFAHAAEGFTALAPIQGLTSPDVTSVVNSGDFATFFNNLYRFLIGLAAVLAVIMIIWGGLEYATQDVPGAKQNGKDRIQQAIFGLVLVLSPVLVFSIINPSILNLSLNIQPITSTYISSNSNDNLLTSSITPQAVKAVANCETAQGPIPGTIAATCRDVDKTSAQSAANEFVAKNCPTSATIIGGVSAAVGSRPVTEINSQNVQTTRDTLFAANAWCSQIRSVTGIYKPSVDSGITFYDVVGYFTDAKTIETLSGSFVCKDWTLHGTFKISSDISSLGDCPNDTQSQAWYKSHIRTTPSCGPVTFYCVRPSK